MAGKKILIIDDEVKFGQLVKMNLGQVSDFEVSLAASGKDGLKLAKKLKPDLILLDIIMPGLNGFEVLERLKNDRATREIPVVMLTAMDDDKMKIRSAQLYDEAYITKPISAGDLKSRIDEVLKRKQAG